MIHRSHFATVYIYFCSPIIAISDYMLNKVVTGYKDVMKNLLVFATLLMFNVSALAVSLTHNKIQSDKDLYFIRLIELALSKAGMGSEFQLTETNEVFNQLQLIERVKDGRASIVWAGTQSEYEKELRPIRIPLLKGLQGHRLFIINPESQSRLKQVDSLVELKQLKAGQGKFWGDTKILRNAGLDVVTSVKKENLFHMVDGGRFDYFPLAVHEPWDEIVARPNLDLTVDSELLLVYPMPMYFFVNRDNHQLAEAIEFGLNQAIIDGSFDEIFYETPHIKKALERAQLASRTVINIKNPDLPSLTPLNRKELWLDVGKTKF